MFRRKPSEVNDIVLKLLRSQGLETPLLQRRLVSAWDAIASPAILRQTGERFIRNQTLMVKINNPALRADLNMERSRLRDRLNAAVGSQVITEIRFY